MSSSQSELDPKLDLVLERVIPLPKEVVWKAWTTPHLLVQWFAPKPWSTKSCELDLRSGGRFRVVMVSPENQEMPCSGCYLRVEEPNTLVWTDALKEGFRPSENPFFTAVLTFEQHPDGTLYRAIAKHKDEEVRKSHEELGFHSGWNTCVDQLIEVMKK